MSELKEILKASNTSSEWGHDSNFKWRKTTAGISLAAVVIGIFGGCGESSSKIREGLKDEPRVRIDYDFGGGYVYSNNEYNWNNEKCLGNGPYDLVTSEDNVVPAIVKVRIDDGKMIAAITPAQGVYPGEPSLQLVGFENYEATLQPYTDADAILLRSNGCDFTQE